MLESYCLKLKVVKKPATKAREGTNPFTGEKMTIKGREVKAYPGGKPAQVWGNGSLSIDVPAKTKANRITQMWFKPGAEAELLKHFERGC